VSAHRDVERVGPFLASFAKGSSNPFFNYAIPDDGAEPGPAEVVALVEAYEARGLRPRLEYVPGLAPRVERALLAAGFEAEGRLVLMEPAESRPVATPAGIELVVPSTDDEFLGLRKAQFEAYAEPEPPTADDAASLRRSLAAGGGAVLARTVGDRLAVGAGEFTPIVMGVSEITSIGVVPAYRRRGIAAAICARLALDVEAAGATSPFLMANEAESRVYARVGFAPAGEMLHISRPAKPATSPRWPTR